MKPLVVASVMSSVADPFFERVACALAASVQRTPRFLDGSWQERLARIDAGDVDVAMMCGIQYTREADRWTPLAALVMPQARYGDRPVYFSDVCVRTYSPFTHFEQLRSARVAYNGRESFSGFVRFCAHLAHLPDGANFCDLRASGSHLDSLQGLLRGEVDAAILDSQVLDFLAFYEKPEPGLRRLESIGPNPAPPVVVRAGHEDEARLREALLTFNCGAAPVQRFAAVVDADYEPIRVLALQAQSIIDALKIGEPSA